MLYEVITLREELEKKDVDMITFSSSSTVRNFLSMVNAESQEELRKLLDGVKIASIGPITGKTVTDNGLQVDLQPEQFTIPDLVDAIVDYYRK